MNQSRQAQREYVQAVLDPLRRPSRNTARTGTSGSSPRCRPLRARNPSRPRPRRSPARCCSQDLAWRRRPTSTPGGMPPLLPPRHRRAQELSARPQIRRLPLLQARALHETQARSDLDRWSENFTFNWSVTRRRDAATPGEAAASRSVEVELGSADDRRDDPWLSRPARRPREFRFSCRIAWIFSSESSLSSRFSVHRPTRACRPGLAAPSCAVASSAACAVRGPKPTSAIVQAPAVRALSAFVPTLVTPLFINLGALGRPSDPCSYSSRSGRAAIRQGAGPGP